MLVRCKSMAPRDRNPNLVNRPSSSPVRDMPRPHSALAKTIGEEAPQFSSFTPDGIFPDALGAHRAPRGHNEIDKQLEVQSRRLLRAQSAKVREVEHAKLTKELDDALHLSFADIVRTAPTVDPLELMLHTALSMHTSGLASSLKKSRPVSPYAHRPDEPSETSRSGSPVAQTILMSRVSSAGGMLAADGVSQDRPQSSEGRGVVSPVPQTVPGSRSATPSVFVGGRVQPQLRYAVRPASAMASFGSPAVPLQSAVVKSPLIRPSSSPTTTTTTTGKKGPQLNASLASSFGAPANDVTVEQQVVGVSGLLSFIRDTCTADVPTWAQRQKLSSPTPTSSTTAAHAASMHLNTSGAAAERAATPLHSTTPFMSRPTSAAPNGASSPQQRAALLFSTASHQHLRTSQDFAPRTLNADDLIAPTPIPRPMAVEQQTHSLNFSSSGNTTTAVSRGKKQRHQSQTVRYEGFNISTSHIAHEEPDAVEVGLNKLLRMSVSEKSSSSAIAAQKAQRNAAPVVYPLRAVFLY